MQNCLHCGAEQKITGRFCSECGGMMEAAATAEVERPAMAAEVEESAPAPEQLREPEPSTSEASVQAEPPIEEATPQPASESPEPSVQTEPLSLFQPVPLVYTAVGIVLTVYTCIMLWS